MAEPQKTGQSHRRHGTIKRDRFNARLTEEQKQLFARAAALSGESISQFVISRAQRAAEKAIQSHDIIRVSARDAQTIMEALLHPPAPGEALLKAAARYQELIGESDL